MDEALIKRVLPHSVEAEKSVIGSMMMDEDAVAKASEILVADDFYGRQYGVVFDAMVEMYNQGKPVDLITLNNKLKEKDVPPELAGIEFIKELLEAVPTSANIKHYAEIVHEKAMLRRIIKITDEISNECYMGRDSLENILNETERRVFGLIQTNSENSFITIRQIVMNVLDKIEEASKSKSIVTGVPTGFTDLDYKTAGLQPSDLVLIAARPSMGKTAFVLNIAEHLAFKKNMGVAIFSLEMSKEQLVNRLFAQESRVDSQAIRTGKLSESDWEKLIDSANVIGNSKLVIDDTPSIGVAEMRTKCRKFKLENDIQLIVIDYLQLMSGGKRSDNRQQEISDISRALKGLARELNVPIIALSQLNRALEQRQDRRPMLSDLRDSGAIEQDADVVMFLYRDEYYHPDTEDKSVAEVIIAKQRNGPVGTIKLMWQADFTKFVNREQ
ncbi:replicative DNA helicase [Parasporobacterium paucivorans]|uniref:Replicative DNA helicase n=1 Tax=Parasporobacterium paucivorans DSM 15970 TaxID=1122934 RepID=A0A1M6J2M6_9FIRM|nr:replicative DNA helicase [Parasporobacterium paucivorans]SHJ40821.1 primary replicative DNA helicase [Parasporobacterium paucivorans DSM 15970]